MTRLAFYADRVMEAGWIVALVTTPLFFNVFSSRIFEPDKIALLRSIALIVLVSWIVKALEATRGREEARLSLRQILRTPLMIPVLALIFNYLLSTLLSVAPLISLWGSYQRLQGTFTTYSYLVFFFSIVFNRPSQEQIRRLVTVMVVVSLPIAVYGLLQRYRIDPIPWGGDVSVRIASTLGNSIFVAAYLIMVFPLTLGRAVESFRRMLRSEALELRSFLLSSGYVFIGLLQVIALYFSGSRGPALGWLASLAFFALCLSLIAGKRNYGLGVLVLSALVAVFLIVFNLPRSPFESLKSHPSIGRFGQLLDPQSNNARVRTYIWQGAAKLYGFHPPLEYPDGRKDPFNWVRPIFGYGPETMYVAYNRFYVPELTQVERRNASPDRSHNESWDALVITGAIGFLVYVGLFLGLFTYGFETLDLIQSEGEKKWFWVWVVVWGIVSSLALVLWRGVAYFGVAFPLGMVLGFLGFLGIKLLFPRGPQSGREKDFSKALLVTSLLAAILAHFVEINFGIAIAATRTYFWTIAALLVTLVSSEGGAVHGREDVGNEREAEAKRKKRVTRLELGSARWGMRGAELSLGLIVALVLVVLGYNFMNAVELGDSALQVLWKSFTEVRKETSFHSNGILIVILLSWLGSALFLVSEETPSGDNLGFALRWLRVSGIGLGFALVYWLIHASLLASIVASPVSHVQEVLARIRQYEGLLTGFYLCVFGLMGVYAIDSSSGGSTLTSWFGERRSVAVGLLCLVLSLMLIYQRNLRVIQADIAFKMSESFARPGSWPVSIQIYQRAIELAPREDYYYLFLGRALLEYAREVEEPKQRDALFSQAEVDLLFAQSLNPLNTDHTANLARLYSQWYLSTSDGELRQKRFQESDRYFALATSLSPNNSRIWGEWAVLLMSNEQTHEQALPKLMRAHQLDPSYDWIAYLFGEYYRIKSQQEEGTAQRQSLEMALSNYLKAESLASDPSSKRTYSLMAAQVALDGGLTGQAIGALEKVLLIDPVDPENWKYAQWLAQLYLQEGQRDRALAYAQEALRLAPSEQQKSIEEFIEQLTDSK